MTEIYLIRHAQAEGNRFRIMQGHWDGGVTELGRRQIALLSDRLRDLSFDAVCSSDLYRAMLTASAVYKPRSLPLYTTPALRELNIGHSIIGKAVLVGLKDAVGEMVEIIRRAST